MPAIIILNFHIRRDIRQRENKSGETPIDLAEKLGHVRMMKILKGDIGRSDSRSTSRTVSATAPQNSTSRPSSSGLSAYISLIWFHIPSFLQVRIHANVFQFGLQEQMLRLNLDDLNLLVLLIQETKEVLKNLLFPED